jgi:DNA modification methylase
MLILGDARRIPLADKSVQCVVTSPPYFGLRAYLADDNARKALEIGAEETPEQYISTMVHIFRDVRRVLRDDGTVWLNLGNSYANSVQAGNKAFGNPAFNGSRPSRAATRTPSRSTPDGLKPKDLIGIPWRVALALQADGWFLRADVIEEVELYCPCGCGYVMEERIWRHAPDREIVWRKNNPMPESCTDRPTKSHEYIFLLSKNERYFYDNEAVKERVKADLRPAGWAARKANGATGGCRDRGANQQQARGVSHDLGGDDGSRNLRSVWTVNLRPYKGAHFATYPPELITPCIKAGTSEKGRCPMCGAPWRRVVERIGEIAPTTVAGRIGTAKRRKGIGATRGRSDDGNNGNYVGGDLGTIRETIGWEPSCACPAHEPVPCILFDPFVGSGTTIQESQRLGRVCVGMELSEKSLKLARDRIERPHKPQSARDPGEFLPLFDRDGDASP